MRTSPILDPFSKTLNTLLLCTILFVLLPFAMLSLSLPVQAQDDLPPWRKNLKCNPAQQKYRGLEYCTSRTVKAYVVVVDLLHSDARFEYILADGVNREGVPGPCRDVNIPTQSTGPGCRDKDDENKYPIMSLVTAVSRFPEAAVVINSDYGAGSQAGDHRGHGPEGFTVVQSTRMDGTRINDPDNNAVKRPWLAIGQNPLRVEFGQMESDDGSAPDWIYTGVGGAPWLVQNGTVETEKIARCENADMSSCTSSSGQTAAGITAGGHYLFLVVTYGLNAQQTADFMVRELGVETAIKFDGGGSSQLYYGGLPGKDPLDRVPHGGDGRWLSHYLAVIAEPGSGIKDSVALTPTPTSSFTATPHLTQTVTPAPLQPGARPSPGSGWWDRLKKKVASWTVKKIDGFGMGSSTHLRVGMEQLDGYLDRQQSIGVQWIREEFPWNEIEPGYGNYRFAYAWGNTPRDYAAMLSSAQKRNLKVMGLLVYGPIYSPAPSEEQLLSRWQVYVSTVVEKFGSQVDAWEIGNEMNSRLFWGKVVDPGSDHTAEPNPALYAKMLVIAHDVIKQKDPQALIVLGGLVTYPGDPPDCHTNPFTYLKGIHDAGAWDKFDVIGFHPYWGEYAPEFPVARGRKHDPDTGECLSGDQQDTLITEVRSLRHLAQQFGDKPVWITELGWDQTWLQNIASYRGSTPDQIEADFVARSYVPLLSEPGVENIFWYTLVGDGQNESFVLGAPGLRAYHNLSQLLAGSQPLGQFQGQNDHNQPGDDDVYEYRFKQGGQTVIVVWKARGGEKSRDVVVQDLTWKSVISYPLDAAEISEETGRELTVTDGKVTLALNEHPIILIAGQKSWWTDLGDWWKKFSRDPLAGPRKWWEDERRRLLAELERLIKQQRQALIEGILSVILNFFNRLCCNVPLTFVPLTAYLFWRHYRRSLLS